MMLTEVNILQFFLLDAINMLRKRVCFVVCTDRMVESAAGGSRQVP